MFCTYLFQLWQKAVLLPRTLRSDLRCTVVAICSMWKDLVAVRSRYAMPISRDAMPILRDVMAISRDDAVSDDVLTLVGDLVC
jgi:hypothetical protein